MNIVYQQSNPVTAKTCGCKEIGKQKVTYAFTEYFHNICLDKKELTLAEIEACEKLLKYATSESERNVVEKEIAELKIALDLMT